MALVMFERGTLDKEEQGSLDPASQQIVVVDPSTDHLISPPSPICPTMNHDNDLPTLLAPKGNSVRHESIKRQGFHPAEDLPALPQPSNNQGPISPSVKFEYDDDIEDIFAKAPRLDSSIYAKPSLANQFQSSTKGNQSSGAHQQRTQQRVQQRTQQRTQKSSTQSCTPKSHLYHQNPPYSNYGRNNLPSISDTVSKTLFKARDLIVKAYHISQNRDEQSRLLDLLEIFTDYTEKGILNKASNIIATQVANLENATRQIETKTKDLEIAAKPVTLLCHHG